MKMIFLIQILAVSLLVAFVIPVSAAPAAVTAQTLEAIRKKHDLPALAVVVVKDGAIRDRLAVGVRKLGDPTPVTTNDLFHIGSCTKSMTATLAAMLIEDGKLKWDTTIADVFLALDFCTFNLKLPRICVLNPSSGLLLLRVLLLHVSIVF